MTLMSIVAKNSAIPSKLSVSMTTTKVYYNGGCKQKDVIIIALQFPVLKKKTAV